MSMSFFERLSQRVQKVDSLLCVGLDPHPDDLKLPTVEFAREFCLTLIENTANFAAAYKPNIAFFEAFGSPGYSILQEVIASIPDGIPVILDAKRGDIASTAEAYAKSAFQVLKADAITINPYLGYDAIEPFLVDPERGVFLLCKTSNPGAVDLQDLLLQESTPSASGDEKFHLYEKVTQLASGWNTRDNLGLVVGATQPEALKRVRLLAPDLWILAPGVGAQGGDLHTAIEVGLRSDGMGLLFPVSRGISRSSDQKNAAEDLREKINEHRNKVNPISYPLTKPDESCIRLDEFHQLADGLLEAGCIKFGQFTLKSGIISPIYIDLRQLVSFPKLLYQVANAYLTILNNLSFDRLAGLPYAAIPIATAISIQGGWPMIYPRKEAKTYGTKAEIEGIYHQGERVVVIDDLATTGSSKFEAIDKLTSEGLIVKDVVVLIDRQSGADQALSEAGYKLHSITTLTSLLDYYEKSGKVDKKHIDDVREFLSNKSVTVYPLFRSVLFKLDPERAHHLTLDLIRLAGSIQPVRWLLRQLYSVPEQPVQAFGLKFPNPIGLAAGYDKDGKGWRGLACLGFGHIEIGTVTPKPQPGNPKPRIFRLPAEKALINRMGFPGLGQELVKTQINQATSAKPCVRCKYWKK